MLLACPDRQREGAGLRSKAVGVEMAVELRKLRSRGAIRNIMKKNKTTKNACEHANILLLACPAANEKEQVCESCEAGEQFVISRKEKVIEQR